MFFMGVCRLIGRVLSVACEMFRYVFMDVCRLLGIFMPLLPISGISNPKEGTQTSLIRICDRHTFDAYSASGMSNPKGSNTGYQNILSTHA